VVVALAGAEVPAALAGLDPLALDPADPASVAELGNRLRAAAAGR
jgi:hypothetical protein